MFIINNYKSWIKKKEPSKKLTALKVNCIKNELHEKQTYKKWTV